MPTRIVNNLRKSPAEPSQVQQRPRNTRAFRKQAQQNHRHIDYSVLGRGLLALGQVRVPLVDDFRVLRGDDAGFRGASAIEQG